MPPEELKTADNLNNTNEKLGTENQVNDFPITTKLLDTKLKDKKDNIQKVLDNELKVLFENNPNYRRICLAKLLACPNNETEIKGIFLANLPEGYAYKIGGLGEGTVKSEKYNKAIIVTQQQEKVTQQQEKVTQQQEKVTQQQEIGNQIEKMKKAIEARDQLVEKYKSKDLARDLNTITNENSENYQVVKTQLEKNGTLNQLRQNHDEQFINDYILVQTTLQELKSNPTIYEKEDISYFDKIVKNLDNACNIPDTKLNDFSKNNIQATRKELFHDSIGNQGLIEQRQINIESHNSEYEKLFPQEETEKIIAKYGKFLDGDLKRFWERYQSNSHIQQRVNNMKNDPGNIISEEDKRLINNYNILLSSCENVRNKMESDTKNMIEELCMTSQIKGFLGCIPEEYANNFQFNKANEVSINQNGILQLDGHINGFNFSLRQDTNYVNTRLQISTMMSKESDNSLDFTGKYKNSPFILPTADQVFQQAIGAMNMEELLKIENQDEYFKTLEDLILKKMDKLYADTKYTHNYVKEQIKNEEIINETMGIMKNLGGMNRKTLSGDNEKLYDFFNTIHFNLQNMTSGERELFGKSIKKLGEIIRTEGNDASRPDSLARNENISEILGSKEKTKKEIEGFTGYQDDQTLLNAIKLFFKVDERNKGGNEKMINVSEFYNFITTPDNPNGYKNAKLEFEKIKDEKMKDGLDERLEENI